ncbi:hypothetical protein GCM10020220_040440 [Nonomuraea rubra]
MRRAKRAIKVELGGSRGPHPHRRGPDLTEPEPRDRRLSHPPLPAASFSMTTIHSCSSSAVRPAASSQTRIWSAEVRTLIRTVS